MKTGLLIGYNPSCLRNLYNLHFRKDQIGTLYVKILPNSRLEQPVSNRDLSFSMSKPSFRKKVLSFYQQLPNVDVDIRVLLTNFRSPVTPQVITNKPIEIVYFDSLYSGHAIDKFIQNCIVNKSPDIRTISYSTVDDDSLQQSDSEDEASDYQMVENVVLGGTFDKLHVGHKILLSEAIMKCKKHLVVAVSAETLLQTKILRELIDDWATRSKSVSLFLNDVEPNLEYEIIPLYDVYGPTKTDPSFELIVISSDTLRGAEMINEYRESVGLDKLIIHTIDLIESSKEFSHEEQKVSSSNIRMHMLGQLLRPPKPRPNLPLRPYIIGLTGGIASGKSSVCDVLQSLGCGYINCDNLAHQMYQVGSAGYNFIKKTFGIGVINEDGSVNRKALGSIVFSDPAKLDELNRGIWPYTLEALKQKVSTIDKEVVVVEAALLIQANWETECHEIWSCIIPPKEAIQRLQTRNNLTAEEAQLRIDSLPKNEVFVAHSNVVFSTLWDSSFTRKQVEKAWTSLQNRLPATQ